MLFRSDDETMMPLKANEEIIFDDNSPPVYIKPTVYSFFPGCVALGVQLTSSEYKKALNILDIPTNVEGKKALDSYFKKDKWAFASFIKDRVDRAVEKTTDFGFPPYDLLFANEELFDSFLTVSKQFFGDTNTLTLYEALSDNNFFTEEFELYGGVDSYDPGNPLNVGLRKSLTDSAMSFINEFSGEERARLLELSAENQIGRAHV